MALSTARMHKVRGRPPLLAAGISSLSHSHSSSVRSLGYVFSFIFSFYTTHEDFSDRLSDRIEPNNGRGATLACRDSLGHVVPEYAPATSQKRCRRRLCNGTGPGGAMK